MSGGGVTIGVDRLFLRGAKPRGKQVGAFHIARYPVTVAQYRAFLEAGDGWRDPQWWGADLYHDPEGDSYEFDRYGNHPAVYVSWFDAVAFCRWLSRRLDLEVRSRFRSWSPTKVCGPREGLNLETAVDRFIPQISD